MRFVTVLPCRGTNRAAIVCWRVAGKWRTSGGGGLAATHRGVFTSGPPELSLVWCVGRMAVRAWPSPAARECGVCLCVMSTTCSARIYDGRHASGCPLLLLAIGTTPYGSLFSVISYSTLVSCWPSDGCVEVRVVARRSSVVRLIWYPWVMDPVMLYTCYRYVCNGPPAMDYTPYNLTKVCVCRKHCTVRRKYIYFSVRIVTLSRPPWLSVRSFLFCFSFFFCGRHRPYCRGVAGAVTVSVRRPAGHVVAGIYRMCTRTYQVPRPTSLFQIEYRYSRLRPHHSCIARKNVTIFV